MLTSLKVQTGLDLCPSDKNRIDVSFIILRTRNNVGFWKLIFLPCSV